MAVHHTRGLTAAVVALALVGAGGSSASAETGEAGVPPAAPEQKSAGSNLSSSKMTGQELAAFRKAQGYKGDGKKDEAWLKSLRQKFRTGEFAPATSTTATLASGTSVSTSVYDPNALTTGPGY